MPSVLVSGAPERVAAVSRALLARGASVTEVVNLADMPAACEAAGSGSFDAYVQLGVAFEVAGESTVQRVRHFYADGVLARFAALDAALPALSESAELIFVMGVLPPEVASADDREARRALTRILARAARADASPGTLRVRILDADTDPDRIAAFALGTFPTSRPDSEPLAGRSLDEWRVEMLSVVLLDT